MNNLFSCFDKFDVGNYIIRHINENDYEDIYDIYGDTDVMKYDIDNLLNSSLEIIEASIDTENIASVTLVEKLGFELKNKENNKLIFAKKLK
ncbi:MAG: hypothetical protein ACRC3Y_10785 [Romboutsia sp.]|uniref:hypothetical protein n=1 Tax=Romboutsia sp. TaxID=1965302 RepID=UPI003F2D5345